MRLVLTILISTIVLLVPLNAFAAKEIKSISFPAVSADGKTVYFSAWGDIWSSPRDGNCPARRLTDNVAMEARPTISPDGSQIAFLSDRYGNYDIFVMPEQGGDAKRLTWDSGTDYPYDWNSDGTKILAYAMRQDQWCDSAYEINLDKSKPVRLTGPDFDDNVFISYLQDDKHLVYTRGPGDWTRKHNHSQSTYDLWTFNSQTGKHKQITTYDGTDMWPQPSPDGKTVYFVSDRDGTNNIWSINIDTGKEKQHTYFKVDGPLWPRISSDGDEIAFEVFGELWIYSIPMDKSEKVNVTFSDDSKHEMIVDEDIPNQVSEYALSPNGKYYAVVVLGDIFILKNPDSYKEEEKPDQDLSRTYQVAKSDGREMNVTWHPDNTKIAYISDRDGQFDVFILDLVTMQEKKITDTKVDESQPKFAPHNDKLAFYSGNRQLMIYDMKEEKSELLHEGQLKNGPWLLGYEWAPDSAWISYVESNLDSIADVFIINLTDKKPVNVSSTPDWDSNPSWSMDGKYLAFYSGFESGSKVMLLELNPKKEIYDTQLLFPEDIPEEPKEESVEEKKSETTDEQPAEVSEEKTAESEEVKTDETEEAKPEEKADETEEEKIEPVVIDLDRIHLRAESIVSMNANSYAPTFAPTSDFLIFVTDHEGAEDWWSITVDGGEMNKLASAMTKDYPQFTADSKKLYFLDGGRITFLDMNGPKSSSGGAVAVTSRMTVNQYKIWEQMMVEGWRQIRDSFYDENLHGVNWNEVLARYRPRIKDCGTSYEYANLFRQMLGELNSSHLGFYSNESDAEAPAESTGELGVLFDESWDGPGWKVVKVIHDSPADQPTSKLFVEDVILKINDHEITNKDNPEILLRNLTGIPTKIVVRNDKRIVEPTEDQAVTLVGDPEYVERDVVIKPTSKRVMTNLLYNDWVLDNRNRVYDRSDKKIAYQHIRQMNGSELERFRRELFTESLDKKALIIDVRFNGGGNIATDLVDILMRTPAYKHKIRDGEYGYRPAQTWKGPIVVLINAQSFSNAEIFGHIMRDLGLATIMGESTGGGVISTYDFTLMDGSGFRMPAWLNARLNGVNMEHNGVVPDIYIHIDPEKVAKGEDNQLEAAIDFLLKKL